MRFINIGFMIALLIALIGLPNPTRAEDSAGITEATPDYNPAVEAPSQTLSPTDEQAIDATYTYHWTVGSAFQPRDNDVGVSYLGAGCVYRTSSPSTLDGNAFAVDLQLPQNTVIVGIRVYVKDTSANNSDMVLFSYDGAGTATDEGRVSTSGTPGYASFYANLPTPYTVNNTSRSLSLSWYSNDNNSTMALCGVRLYLERAKSTETVPTFEPEEQASIQAAQKANASNSVSTLVSRSSFIAGASFQRRTSATTYGYPGRGCLYSASGGFFSIDVDIPRFASVSGVRLYWNDTSGSNGMTMWLTDYDGLGGYDHQLSFTNGSASTGYGSLYNVLPASYSFNPANRALGVTVTMPADVNVWFCGVRILYTIDIPKFDGTPIPSVVQDDKQSSQLAMIDPTTEGTGLETIQMVPSVLDETKLIDSATTRYYYRFMYGNVFQPWNSSTTFANPGAGCTNLTGGTQDIATAIHLPDGATLFGGYLYYYDSNATTSSTLFVTDYNAAGAFNQFIIESSVGSAGYGSVFFSPATTYKVDNFSKPMALVWNPGTADATQRLCGVRLIYSMKISAPLFIPTTLK